MKNIFIALLMGASFIAAGQTVSEKDTKFARTAAEDNLMEIKLGELAQSKATTSVVKTHAQHMIDDHTKANEELKVIAAKKNITLPSGLNEKQQKWYDKMASLSGKDFDKKFTKCMVKDHKKAICIFKKESKKADDAELKVFAAQKIPTLEHHLDMWKEACKTIKK